MVADAALVAIRTFARAALSSGPRSTEIKVGDVSFYSKPGPSFKCWCTLKDMPWGGEIVKLLDDLQTRSSVRVLSLDSIVCKPQRAGILTRVLEGLEYDAASSGTSSAFVAVQIPNVVNAHLAKWLQRRVGYRTHAGNMMPDFVYMPSYVETVDGDTSQPLLAAAKDDTDTRAASSRTTTDALERDLKRAIRRLYPSTPLKQNVFDRLCRSKQRAELYLQLLNAYIQTSRVDHKTTELVKLLKRLFEEHVLRKRVAEICNTMMGRTISEKEIQRVMTAIGDAANQHPGVIQKILMYWEREKGNNDHGGNNIALDELDKTFFVELLRKHATTALYVTKPNANEFHSAVAGAPKGKGNASSTQ